MMHALRTLRWSAWLAWQMESNWTSPLLFAVYVLARPLTASLLLVCMYWAVGAATGGAAPEAYLPFFYVGSACYMLVAGVTFGTAEAVISDREKYGMLKFVRLTPAPLPVYLIGRGLSRAGIALLGALVALLFGLALLPEVRARLGQEGIAWGWLGVYVALGVALLLSLGMILAGAVLNMGRYGSFLSEAVAGLLYLMSGVVFPIGALPAALQPVSLALPTTYWLEGMRRALLGPTELPSPLGGWGHGGLALALAASTAALAAAAWWFFRWGERRAWRLGRFDEVSGY